MKHLMTTLALIALAPSAFAEFTEPVDPPPPAPVRALIHQLDPALDCSALGAAFQRHLDAHGAELEAALTKHFESLAAQLKACRAAPDECAELEPDTVAIDEAWVELNGHIDRQMDRCMNDVGFAINANRWFEITIRARQPLIDVFKEGAQTTPPQTPQPTEKTPEK